MREIIQAAGSSPQVSLTLFEIGAVFVLLSAISYLAFRLKISNVPLFLLIGLAFGRGGIVPLELSEEFLNIGAGIGAIMLLLNLGFEYSANELVDTFKKRWHAGLLDVALNAVPAAIIAYLLGFGWLGALTFAGVMFVSSSGIASQLIRETGWAKSRVASRATGILVFEDILLAPYLPILASAVLGLGAIAGLISVGVALLVTLAIFIFSSGREIPGLRSLSQKSPGVLLLLVFGTALAVSGLADLNGFSGAIAAFLLGLLLTGEVADSLRNRFAPLREIFAAIFFLFFGLSITFADLVAVLPIALLFSVFGIAGKLVLGWWIGRDLSDSMSWKRIGAFLISRGEFSMIIASTVALSGVVAGVKEITLGVVLITAISSTLAMRALRSKFDR